MKGRLIFKNSKNEFITKDINMQRELEDAKGIYTTGRDIFDFDLVGVQWLSENDQPRSDSDILFSLDDDQRSLLEKYQSKDTTETRAKN